MRRVLPPLMVITDTTVLATPLLEARIEEVLARSKPASVIIQLRDRQLGIRERLALGTRLRECCRRYDQWFAVNDRLDVARLLDADAVHLGEGSVDVHDARAFLGPGVWVSVACHEASRAGRLDADAVVVSPIMAPRKGNAPLGVDGIAAARASLDAGRRGAELYALGGVDASNAASCLEHGAAGVAVVRSVLGDAAPWPLLAALRILR